MFQTFSFIQNCAGYSGTYKTEAESEEQEHKLSFTNQTDAHSGHINLLISVQNFGFDYRASEKNSGLRNEMLPQDSEHLIYGPFHQKEAMQTNPSCCRLSSRPFKVET